MSSKINWLLKNTAPGSIVLQSWLTKHGISPQLAAKYNGSDWIHKLANGVYVRSGKKQGGMRPFQRYQNNFLCRSHLPVSLVWLIKASHIICN
jgi:hypothetical protein